MVVFAGGSSRIVKETPDHPKLPTQSPSDIFHHHKHSECPSSGNQRHHPVYYPRATPEPRDISPSNVIPVRQRVLSCRKRRYHRRCEESR